MAPLIWALYRMAAGRSMSFSLIGLLLGMLGVLFAAGASVGDILWPDRFF